jgi:hypothetical protein
MEILDIPHVKTVGMVQHSLAESREGALEAQTLLPAFPTWARRQVIALSATAVQGGWLKKMRCSPPPLSASMKPVCFQVYHFVTPLK